MERFLQAGEEGSGEMADERAQIFSPGSAVPHSSLLKAADCSLNCGSICIILESNLLWKGSNVHTGSFIAEERERLQPVVKPANWACFECEQDLFLPKTYSIVLLVVKYFCDSVTNKIVFHKLCFLVFSLPEGLINAL